MASELFGERCAACTAADFELRFRVRDDAGWRNLMPTTMRFGSALGDIVRCRRCGHMQVAPMPAAAALEQAYAAVDSDDYVDEEAGQRATAGAALERIEAHAGGRGAIIDLGCWCGFLLVEAEARGWRAFGVEPSEFASAFARAHFGLDVRTGDVLSEPLPAGRFDAAVMADVIEHLPDAGAALDRVAATLHPDGVLWLGLPDAGSLLARLLGRRWWSVIPTHVHYFTRASITTLLERCGWEVLEIATAPKAFTVHYYVGRVGGYSEPLARAAHAAVRRAGVAERLWAPDFRDRMSVLARLRRRQGAPEGARLP